MAKVTIEVWDKEDGSGTKVTVKFDPPLKEDDEETGAHHVVLHVLQMLDTLKKENLILLNKLEQS